MRSLTWNVPARTRAGMSSLTPCSGSSTEASEVGCTADATPPWSSGGVICSSGTTVNSGRGVRVGRGVGGGVAVGPGVTVTSGVGVGVGGACTMTVPSIPKWNRQKYENEPAASNATDGEAMLEETWWSQSPVGAPRKPLVVVCGLLPPFCQVIVSPTVIVIDEG